MRNKPHPNPTPRPSLTAELLIEPSGNGLAVPLPANIAKAAGGSKGTTVVVEVVDQTVVMRRFHDEPELTLEQRLEAFDPAKHGGEAMAWACVGQEVFWDHPHEQPR
jgi:antitoxin MazE